MASFIYPSLGGVDLAFVRLVGPGLGNLLFPWARAVVASRNFDLPLIDPAWTQLKLGPLLRGQLDKRTYSGLFNPLPGSIFGMRKAFLLASALRFNEKELNEIQSCRRGRNSIVVFEGMAGYFSSILKDYELVRRMLFCITKQLHKQALSEDMRDVICVHVRLSDFAYSENPPPFVEGGRNLRVPLDWYGAQISQLNEALGGGTKFWVFSDGTDEELAPLLHIRNVQRMSFGSAIADLIALSRARLLICSGSTFSMWASYLGRMPAIWYPGQLRQKLYANSSQADWEIESGAQIPSTFLEIGKRALVA